MSGWEVLSQRGCAHLNEILVNRSRLNFPPFVVAGGHKHVSCLPCSLGFFPTSDRFSRVSPRVFTRVGVPTATLHADLKKPLLDLENRRSFAGRSQVPVNRPLRPLVRATTLSQLRRKATQMGCVYTRHYGNCVKCVEVQTYVERVSHLDPLETIHISS